MDNQGSKNKTRIVVRIKNLEEIKPIMNNVPILGLSEKGKKYIKRQYKIAKAFGRQLNIKGIEIAEEKVAVPEGRQ